MQFLGLLFSGLRNFVIYGSQIVLIKTPLIFDFRGMNCVLKDNNCKKVFKQSYVAEMFTLVISSKKAEQKTLFKK